MNMAGRIRLRIPEPYRQQVEDATGQIADETRHIESRWSAVAAMRLEHGPTHQNADRKRQQHATQNNRTAAPPSQQEVSTPGYEPCHEGNHVRENGCVQGAPRPVKKPMPFLDFTFPEDSTLNLVFEPPQPDFRGERSLD